jgi:single-strand DNA-binding protein
MSSLNAVQLIGRLGRDPEARSMPSGGSVVNLSIATTESWNDKGTGERQERAEWHRVVVFGRRGEACVEYLSTGDLVFVHGSIRTRKYEKDGIERYSTEIVAQDVQFLQTKRRSSQPANSGESRREQTRTSEHSQPAQRDDFGDDIPF